MNLTQLWVAETQETAVTAVDDGVQNVHKSRGVDVHLQQG